MTMSTSSPSPPDGPLHLLLMSAAFEETARTSSTWASQSDQAMAEEFYSRMVDMLGIELSDPSRVSTTTAVQSVSFLAQAYSAAAAQVRRIDTAPELGGGPMKEAGNANAARWLETQSDFFRLIAQQLQDRTVH